MSQTLEVGAGHDAWLIELEHLEQATHRCAG
jgi:hypothetical protein